MNIEGTSLREGYRNTLMERLNRNREGENTRTGDSSVHTDDDDDDSYAVREADESFIFTSGDVKPREDQRNRNRVKIEEGENDGHNDADSYRYLDLEDDENESESDRYEGYSDIDIDGDDDDYDYDYNYDDDYDYNSRRSRFSWTRLFLVVTILTILLPLLLSWFKGFTSSENMFLSSSTLSNMQKQITHLYSELSVRDQKIKSDFDQRLSLIMSQFERQIKALLPADIMKFDNEIKTLQIQLKQLQTLVESTRLPRQKQGNSLFNMSIENVTQWETQLLSILDERLPERIPVVIDDSQRVLIIPELHRYITDIVSQIAQRTMQQDSDDKGSVHNQSASQFFTNSEIFDLSNYFKEILNDQFQFIDKQYFITELSSHLEKTKQEIWDELKPYLDQQIKDIQRDNNHNNNNNMIPEQYSSIVIKKLVDKFYNANENQWDTDLDFATYTQGTRLIQRLTSPTYPNGNGLRATQLLLLTSSPPSSSSSSYWQCALSSSNHQLENCTFTIHFNRPIYLTKLSYIHGRLKNNLHIMNSAPKRIAVYILLDKNYKPGEDRFIQAAKASRDHDRNNNVGQRHAIDSNYIKIATYKYDLNSPQLNQVFQLPIWYIKQRPLVRSLMFVVEENYGNSKYVSLRKFVVNGVLEEDLEIMMMSSSSS